MEEIDIPQNFINRELSLLEFNHRVLSMASDETVPLLARLQFLFIFSNNMDEFFEIRVSGLKEKISLGHDKPSIDGMTPETCMKKVSERCHELIEQQAKIFHEELEPALAKENIRLLTPTQWNESQHKFCEKMFRTDIMPVISPIGLDLAHPFPRLINKSLNFIVKLSGKDAFGRDSGLAIVHAPRTVPRLIKLPGNEGEYNFTYLSCLIQEFCSELFAGMDVEGCYAFRLTRNSDVYLAQEGIEDLPRALKGELFSRRFGRAVRLEIANSAPDSMVQFLLSKVDLTEDDLYRIKGPVNINRLSGLVTAVDKSELKYAGFVPNLDKKLSPQTDLFSTLKERDVVLHHPYDSFMPVIEFIRTAAKDPAVLAIQQTLYRTGPDSPITSALIEAARMGKEVTVVIELRARFDEEDNIDVAHALQEAGAIVVYGILGYKTHAKMTLVIRREQNKLVRYAHLGTGNYHTENAKLYTDLSLLTHDKSLCLDVHHVFAQITGLGKELRLKHLWQAPFNLKKNVLKAIENETHIASQGKEARIIAKMNSITDKDIILALYAASCAGVQIDLIVRGICCLRPGIKGVSENIRVRSIIGRFLEHTRIYYFLSGGEELLMASSADWMERNFKHRLEVAYPIVDQKLKEHIKKTGLEIYLKDNFQSWKLNSDGSYTRNQSDEPKIAQELLIINGNNK